MAAALFQTSETSTRLFWFYHYEIKLKSRIEKLLILSLSEFGCFSIPFIEISHFIVLGDNSISSNILALYDLDT